MIHGPGHQGAPINLVLVEDLLRSAEIIIYLCTLLNPTDYGPYIMERNIQAYLSLLMFKI